MNNVTANYKPPVPQEPELDSVTLVLNPEQAVYICHLLGASIYEPDGLYDIYTEIKAITNAPWSPYRIIRR